MPGTVQELPVNAIDLSGGRFYAHVRVLRVHDQDFNGHYGVLALQNAQTRKAKSSPRVYISHWYSVYVSTLHTDTG